MEFSTSQSSNLALSLLGHEQLGIEAWVECGMNDIFDILNNSTLSLGGSIQVVKAAHIWFIEMGESFSHSIDFISVKNTVFAWVRSASDQTDGRSCPSVLPPVQGAGPIVDVAVAEVLLGQDENLIMATVSHNITSCFA